MSNPERVHPQVTRDSDGGLTVHDKRSGVIVSILPSHPGSNSPASLTLEVYAYTTGKVAQVETIPTQHLRNPRNTVLHVTMVEDAPEPKVPAKLPAPVRSLPIEPEVNIDWVKVGSGIDIEYQAVVAGGVVVGKAYRGGDRYYPWSYHVPGIRVAGSMTTSTLSSAKQAVEGILRKGS